MAFLIHKAMKKRTQIIILVLLLIFGLIQFIRPQRNQQTNLSRYDILHKTDTEAIVENSLHHACYDCHSNNTVYPWYASIAPVSWMISKHVKHGKKHLNFSEWILYPKEKQLHKLDEIVEVLQENDMPPAYYTMLHREARLDETSKQHLLNWARELKSKISASVTQQE